MNRAAAPLYTDTFRLCEWLLERFEADPGLLPGRILETGLDLHRGVCIALKSPVPEDLVEVADEDLIALRTYLRLAQSRGLLSEDQLLHALECADGIGRQLGGWLRSLQGG